MKEINKVVITGAEEEATKIGEIFARAGVTVIIEKPGNYEAVADTDMVLECFPADIEAKKETLRNYAERAPAMAAGISKPHLDC